MREIIWVAAIAVVAMLLFRNSRTGTTEPPDDVQFTELVVAPSHTVPVVVKFGAEWCGPCRAMERELDKVEQQLAGKVRVIRVDIDEHSDWADHFGVRGIPDTIVFHEGHGVARDTGYMSAQDLANWLQPHLY